MRAVANVVLALGLVAIFFGCLGWVFWYVSERTSVLKDRSLPEGSWWLFIKIRWLVVPAALLVAAAGLVLLLL